MASSNPLLNMLLYDSDFSKFDDELEIFKAISLDNEVFKNEMESSSHGGSVPGHKVINRDHVQGHERLFLDYFAESPV